MNSKAIGVFDTGAGGLATVRELQRLMPGESIVYLADTARAPYGAHSRELITENAMRGLGFLQQQDVKLLVSACGTVSAVLPEQSVKKLSVPLVSTLLPCAQEACAMSASGVIGVIGATAAVRSSAFGKAIRNIRTDARVVGRACPLLLALAENGVTSADDPLVRLTIQRYLEPMLAEGIDTLILASAHYSVLFAAISEVFDYRVTLIDATAVTARYVQSYLLQNDMQNDGGVKPPVWYVTDLPQDFTDLSKLYYKCEITQNVKLVAL
ncbi:glutamate racemase [Clostridiaceae bacterium NSJ-31]|uniref:Glutamate racemase n=1 Tax=Ligaoa zhengdingensis TaxID=2763658 RepID=A0A926I4I2_9FIRM|nr:glutamate racemase [Ligaoa zhengdingensis]MBC8546261.1 glutamate racemase [Ligaoa zhengdingensis]